MCKRCPEGSVLSGRQCTGLPVSYSWQQALQHVEAMNRAVGFASHNDWRLPNIKELLSIVELQCQGPSVNMEVFPFITAGGIYWSATPFAGGGTGIWSVSFISGYGFDRASGTTNKSYVRLVRGGL